MTTVCKQIQRRKYETHRDWVTRVMWEFSPFGDTMYDGPFAYPSNGFLPLEWQSYRGPENLSHFVLQYGDDEEDYIHAFAEWQRNGRFKFGGNGQRYYWTVREFLESMTLVFCECCWDEDAQDYRELVLK